MDEESIKNTLLTDIMADYLEEITANYSVEDSRNNLNYLKVEAAESAAAAASESASAETDASTESGYTDTTYASTESSTAAQ